MNPFKLFDRLTCEEIVEAADGLRIDTLTLLKYGKRCEVYLQETEDYYRERFEKE